MARLVFNHLPTYPSQLYNLALEVVTATAGQIAEEAARSMEGQEPPSSPGHAPAIRSGLLHDGIKSSTIMTSGIDIAATAIAYTDVEYAQHLEYGTVHMEARPFMVPAAERVRPSFEAAMRSAVKRLR
jgi:HK97 gp10 family phage protein